MSNPISVFIMDVSNSSHNHIGNELSAYLQELQESIIHWTKPLPTVKVTHRAGDELVVVSEGFASAYIIAFYISRIWRYPDNPPYFGLSFGFIEDQLCELDIETWIHPLMKQARIANDFLKKQQNRMQFRFELTSTVNENKFDTYQNEFKKLLNTSLTLQQEQINEQTTIQSFVFSLYLILGQQNKVSEYLNRTKATISSHMKNGKTDIILATFDTIVDVLNALEKKTSSHITDELQMKIKQDVNNHVHIYLPKERSL